MTDFVVFTAYSLMMVVCGVLIGFRIAMAIEEKGRQELKRSQEAE